MGERFDFGTWCAPNDPGPYNAVYKSGCCGAWLFFLFPYRLLRFRINDLLGHFLFISCGEIFVILRSDVQLPFAIFLAAAAKAAVIFHPADGGRWYCIGVCRWLLLDDQRLFRGPLVPFGCQPDGRCGVWDRLARSPHSISVLCRLWSERSDRRQHTVWVRVLHAAPQRNPLQGNP